MDSEESVARAAIGELLSDTFPYQVIISNPTAQWEDPYWVLGKNSAYHLRCEWLTSNGIKVTDWDAVHVKCLMPDGRHGFVYYFSNLNHALLFKLTWGGS